MKKKSPTGHLQSWTVSNGGLSQLVCLSFQCFAQAGAEMSCISQYAPSHATEK